MPEALEVAEMAAAPTHRGTPLPFAAAEERRAHLMEWGPAPAYFLAAMYFLAPTARNPGAYFLPALARQDGHA